MSQAAAFRQRILAHCKDQVATKLKERRKALQELIDSTANETKSTAGDKYETGRAMLHIEQDNVRRQLAGIQSQKAVLDAIDTTSHNKIIGAGSLVKTDAGYYFLSVALGKLLIDATPVIALSPHSPLGAKMIRLSVGEHFLMNDRTITIEEIC